MSRFTHLRAPSEELSGGEVGHCNWEGAADLDIVGHATNLQRLDCAQFFFERALRQLIEVLQDKMEELEARVFESRTIAKALAAVAAEQLHQVGGPEALAAWAEVLASWPSGAGSAQ